MEFNLLLALSKAKRPITKFREAPNPLFTHSTYHSKPSFAQQNPTSSVNASKGVSFAGALPSPTPSTAALRQPRAGAELSRLSTAQLGAASGAQQCPAVRPFPRSGPGQAADPGSLGPPRGSPSRGRGPGRACSSPRRPGVRGQAPAPGPAAGRGGA